MRIKVACLVWFIIVTLPAHGQSKARYEETITPAELVRMAQILPHRPIYSLKFLREGRNARLSAAILSSQIKQGWQILLISPSDRHAYKVTWTSPRLDDSFAVSDPRNFDTFGLRDEEALSFAGCAPHMCPDIFSVMLYVPSTHRMFTATCNGGMTSYTPEGVNYKDDLDQLLHRQTNSDKACSVSTKKGR